VELLITGCTGFVGRNLLLRILAGSQWQRWDKIILPVRDPEKLRSQIKEEGREDSMVGERLQICQISGDAWELPEQAQPDWVIHAAGRLFGRTREEYFRTNVEGSRRLVAQLPEKSRMIVLSSLAAGGPTPRGANARTMEDQDDPVSFYGESKLAMEKELRAQLGTRLLILRPPMVLGPRDSATVQLFQMAKGLVRVKPGFAPKQYSWIAVDDLTEAILTATAKEWPFGRDSAYYLSSEGIITDGQLLARAAEVIGRNGVTIPVPQALIQLLSLLLDTVPSWRDLLPSLGPDRVREILPDRWVADTRDFSEAFNWQPRHEFTETLKKTAGWLEAQGSIRRSPSV